MRNQLIISVLVLSFLFIIILVALKDYKKKQKQVITIKKMTFFSVMLAITISLSFFSLWTGIPGSSPKISFDYIPIIMIGFIFGPLEGMLFGIMADSIILLIQGWPWQLFMAVQKPIIGVLGSLAALILSKNIFKKDWVKITFIQCTIFWIFIMTIIFLLITPDNNKIPTDNLGFVWGVIGWGIGTIIIMESLFFYIMKYKKQDLDLFSISFLIIVIARIVNSWILTSIAQNNYYGIPFDISIISRIITTSFAAPINAFVLYWLLKGLLPMIKNISKDIYW